VPIDPLTGLPTDAAPWQLFASTLLESEALRRRLSGVAPRDFAGLATAEEADLLAKAREAESELASAPRRARRRGPATLYERNQRLETAVNVLAGRGRVEYRANTIAVIKDPNIITRIIRWVMAMILIPPHLLAQFMSWVLRPRGKGRLKRRVVFVDRRGNIVVFRA